MILKGHIILSECKLKIEKVVLVILVLFILSALCSCGLKERRQRSEIILVKETEITVETGTYPATSAVKEKVYYTKTGKRYHYSDKCGRGTYYECTLSEAKQRGLSPCDKCVK